MMLQRVASSLYGSLPLRNEPRVGEQYLYVSANRQVLERVSRAPLMMHRGKMQGRTTTHTCPRV